VQVSAEVQELICDTVRQQMEVSGELRQVIGNTVTQELGTFVEYDVSTGLRDLVCNTVRQEVEFSHSEVCHVRMQLLKLAAEVHSLEMHMRGNSDLDLEVMRRLMARMSHMERSVGHLRSCSSDASPPGEKLSQAFVEQRPSIKDLAISPPLIKVGGDWGQPVISHRNFTPHRSIGVTLEAMAGVDCGLDLPPEASAIPDERRGMHSVTHGIGNPHSVAPSIVRSTTPVPYSGGPSTPPCSESAGAAEMADGPGPSRARAHCVRLKMCSLSPMRKCDSAPAQSLRQENLDAMAGQIATEPTLFGA